MPSIGLGAAVAVAVKDLQNDERRIAQCLVGLAPAIDQRARRVVRVVDKDDESSVDAEIRGTTRQLVPDVAKLLPELDWSRIGPGLLLVVDSPFQRRSERDRGREQRT